MIEYKNASLDTYCVFMSFYSDQLVQVSKHRVFGKKYLCYRKSSNKRPRRGGGRLLEGALKEGGVY